jgi:lysophospholipase L1-like esterase
MGSGWFSRQPRPPIWKPKSRKKRLGRARRLWILAASLGLLALLGAAAGLFFLQRAGGNERAPEVLEVELRGAIPDPVLGHRFAPGSEASTRYADNPRNYFEPDGETPWRLDALEQSVARLERPQESSEHDLMSIRQIEAKSNVGWHIQLHADELALREGTRYLLRFRARAESPRPLAVTVSQSHPPWEPLGLYRDVRLTPFWQTFEARFTSPSSDQNARIQFNLGGSALGVDLAAVQLATQGTNEPVVPAGGFVVRYRFDELGCRGPHRGPPTPGTTRVLALGDSATVGVGVKEPDTFSARLERLLNARASRADSATVFEVRNCGVARYDARQARLFYQQVAESYRPQIVLLATGPSEAEETPEVKRLDAVATVGEILELDRETRRQGARLGVVAFRHESLDLAPEWKRLLDELDSRLGESGTPVRDLGLALLSRRRPGELQVYPGLDRHPNEVAHRIAADEIADFLGENGLLTGTGTEDVEEVARARP